MEQGRNSIELETDGPVYAKDFLAAIDKQLDANPSASKIVQVMITDNDPVSPVSNFSLSREDWPSRVALMRKLVSIKDGANIVIYFSDLSDINRPELEADLARALTRFQEVVARMLSSIED